ncbi:gustatory receptor for sugar taste 43a-like isoform X1 [Bombus vosnesenskii]|uniref:Gustatory receptor n=1 Tax=Bombus vosnesenskii TaxID=207650 RepID=A0A6J3LA90_9HYME|nr:gustatory receptor for sugar taste 43a-like isoform X1 [Bombus vosnesenskii]
MELKRIEKKRKASYDGNLRRAMFPIYYLGKLCGVVPVRFYVHASEGCQARLNIIDLVYSLCVLILLLGAEIWGLWRDLKDGWEHSTRLKSRTAVIATCSDVLGVMSLTVVCIVGSPFRWKSLQLVINKLIEVDKKIGVSSTKKARRFTICLTICSLVYLWFNSSLDFYSWSRKAKSQTFADKGPINYAPLYVMYTVIISAEIQYSVATYNIGQRLVRLNSSLKSMLDTNNTNNSNNDDAIDYFRKFSETANDIGGKKGWNITPKRQLVLGSYRLSRKMDESKTYVNSISELIMVHSLLCDTVSLINTAFGVVLLAVTISCLLHLIITPYFLIVQANEKHEWIFLVVQAGWCIIHISRMLIIVQPSYSTVAEGKRTATLVSQLLSCCFEADVRRELEIFSLQLLHRPLEFSACGLFSLDRNLITSVRILDYSYEKQMHLSNT